jgi:hypothetical protein
LGAKRKEKWRNKMSKLMEVLTFDLEGLQVSVEVWWEPEFNYIEIKTPVGRRRFDYPPNIEKEYYEAETIVTVQVGCWISKLIAKVRQGYLILDEGEYYQGPATIVVLQVERLYEYEEGGTKLLSLWGIKENIVEIRRMDMSEVE